MASAQGIVKDWDPRTTYRVRQLPGHLEERSDVAALLIRLDASLGPADNIQIFSLAYSVSNREANCSKTATLRFKSLPKLLSGDGNEWVLPAREAGYPENIIFDTHFLDFTVLNSVDQDTRIFDCIGISGLNSHPFGSWRSRGSDPHFMWLRDKLPRDIPSLRSIIYGYDTHLLLSSSIQTVDDIAKLFLIKLEALNRSPSASRPIVFLSHSLGGIILKRALVLLASSTDAEGEILSSIKAIVQFGVPSHGMYINHLLPMVHGQPNEALIKILSPGSEYLKTLEEQFSGITTLQRIRIISVYETRKSKTAQESEDGIWHMTGPEELLVDPKSSISDRSTENDKIPIDQDHSNLVKFAEDDHNYRAILNRLYTVRQEEIQLHHDETRLIQPKIQAHVGRKAEGDARTQSKLDMMLSLERGVSDDRFREIKAAYEHTFDWIFENRNLSFTQWLQSPSAGIFWIQGKPGSGKSTLLKYVLQDPRTRKLSSRDSSKEKLIYISFFFHNRGSYFQKSFEGLYRNIIYQILDKGPELQSLALPVFDKLKRREKRDRQDKIDWALPNLEELYDAILNQESLNMTIILFLDALDEYDGPAEEITDFVRRTARTDTTYGTKVKICFSSRPWNHFLDHFNSCLGFRIQDHTVRDIRRYVFGRLRAHPASHLFGDVGRDPRTANLVASIITKAEGVFLWVRLIMDAVLESSTAGSTSEDLVEVVHSFPTELEDLYRWTIKRIALDEKVRLESYIIFEVVHRSLVPLSLNKLAMCLRVATSKTIVESGRVSTELSAEIADKTLQDRLERRLKSRCGGLIEIVQDARESKVQFMHQTVKEFVGKPGFQQEIFLPDQLPWASNGHTILSKYMLTRQFQKQHLNYSLLLQDFSNTTGDSTLRKSFMHAFNAESTTGKSQLEFLDSIDDTMFQEGAHRDWRDTKIPIAEHQLNYAKSYTQSNLLDGLKINSVLALAVYFNLKLYVQEKLRDDVRAIYQEKHLLHCTILRMMTTMHHIDMLYGDSDVSEMVGILLSAGADKEEKLNGIGPFELLFQCFQLDDIRIETPSLVLRTISVFLHFGQNPDTFITLRDSDFKRIIDSCYPLHIASTQVAKMLLEYGADVNVRDQGGLTPLDWSIREAEKISGRTSINVASATYSKILLLLDSGGRVTPDTLHGPPGETPLDDCISKLSKHLHLDKRIKSPPILDELTSDFSAAPHRKANKSRPRKRKKARSAELVADTIFLDTKPCFKNLLPKLS